MARDVLNKSCLSDHDEAMMQHVLTGKKVEYRRFHVDRKRAMLSVICGIIGTAIDYSNGLTEHINVAGFPMSVVVLVDFVLGCVLVYLALCLLAHLFYHVTLEV